MSKRFGFAGEDGLPAAGLQETTLAVFTVLSALRKDWRGGLIVAVGLGELGSAVAMAANVAGAACLSVEADAALCRAAVRAGACDFLVNTVDESLRVLKNEIRQGKPLSVALESANAPALAELLARGVLPEVFTSATGVDHAAAAVEAAVIEAAREFAGQGAAVVDLDGLLAGIAGCVDARAMLDACGRMESFAFADAAGLRAFDARTLAAAADGPKRRWAAAAPRLFHRERPFRRVALLDCKLAYDAVGTGAEER